MSSSKFFLAFMLGSCAMLLSDSAHAVIIKDCKVTFSTKGQPVLVVIEGRSEIPCEGSFSVSGENIADAKFTLNLSKLETGIPLRDRHLRENYLHTEKYPEARLTITNAAAFAAQLSGKIKGKSTFAGELELRGTPRPLTDGQYEINGHTVVANFSIDLPDFGMEQPAFMGIKIVDKVYVKVGFEIDGK